MSKYTVEVPIVALCVVKVKADNEEDAIDKALESEDLKIDNIEEWEALRKIVEGNVVHTYNNEAEVMNVEDDSYTVGVPMVGVCVVKVKADNEEDAIDKALESEDLKLDNIEEWEVFRKIAEGNVLNTYINEIEILDVENF